MRKRKVLIGVILAITMIFLVGVSAKAKTKKEATKTETTKSEAACCDAMVMPVSSSCCSQENACENSDEKKDCCQIEKIIAEKKTEINK